MKCVCELYDPTLNTECVCLAKEPKKLKYKYDEDTSIAEFAKYIENTYGEHYAGNDMIQAFDIWEALDNDPSPSHRNTAIKYLYRYGKKGGHNRKDILKTMHYCLLLLHYHNKHHSDKGEHGVEAGLNPPDPHYTPDYNFKMQGDPVPMFDGFGKRI